MFWLLLLTGTATNAADCNYINEVDKVYRVIGYCGGASYSPEHGITSSRIRCVDNDPQNIMMDIYASAFCTGDPICTQSAADIIQPGVEVDCSHGASNPFCPYVFATGDYYTNSACTGSYYGSNALIGTQYCIHNANSTNNGRTYEGCAAHSAYYFGYTDATCNTFMANYTIPSNSCPNSTCMVISSDPGYPTVPSQSTGDCSNGNGGNDDGWSLDVNFTNYDPFPDCNWAFFGQFFTTVGNCARAANESESGLESFMITCPSVNGEPTINVYNGVDDCSGNPTLSALWSNFSYKPQNAAYSCSQGTATNTCPYVKVLEYKEDSVTCHAGAGWEWNTFLTGCVNSADGGSIKWSSCVDSSTGDLRLYNTSDCAGNGMFRDDNCTITCAYTDPGSNVHTTTSDAWMFNKNMTFFTFLLSLVLFTYI